MLKILKNFTDSPTSGGIILFICVLISLTIANSPFGAAFENILNTPLGFETASVHLRYTTALWINDGLMAIFFLLVGLEIKRELVSGELSTPRQALLPIFCAFGGAIVPAGIYFAVNQGTETVSGWGIPMATDIAFALAVIAMLGKRVPASLKVFLAALAIVDDLIAILVIAIFYSAELHTIYLGYAAAILALLFIFNRLGVRSLIFYLIPGLFIWYFVHHSGIHATIAGVLTAMTIPLATKGKKEPPLLKLEHALTTPVNFLIVPLFALANTAIRFEEGMLEGLVSPLGIGIIVGLVLGKPVGVYLMTKLAILLRIGSIPQGASWAQIIGVGLLAGIGFTMSIFIALLSFSDNLLIAEAKFSILVASLLSGITGYILLSRVATPSNDNEKKT
ncbi:Na+/H+ antiporter NhaA [Sphingobacterium phlebotomi]|uniref:Na(+)/H(+) antiporter NhaA n=1 Tax=Sphingobacterium phlebotomi TaxID=2605433 RepID=A0A5D4HD88_9SPHI|nr:Na+/H+ antiporter NhaA [Sphingobacterium phlebotomi]TYR37505.1 Na+/H+ antiporter NhaA [Sphingobacterium phlebotomi]